jgi:hypothetical protein
VVHPASGHAHESNSLFTSLRFNSLAFRPSAELIATPIFVANDVHSIGLVLRPRIVAAAIPAADTEISLISVVTVAFWIVLVIFGLLFLGVHHLDSDQRRDLQSLPVDEENSAEHSWFSISKPP